ncbi:MAG: PKD domain-containing protein [Bacteroidetes bacterium]|nr:MAG: PKD domain-containing protein [Bacteroidota bacterium]
MKNLLLFLFFVIFFAFFQNFAFAQFNHFNLLDSNVFVQNKAIVKLVSSQNLDHFRQKYHFKIQSFSSKNNLFQISFSEQKLDKILDILAQEPAVVYAEPITIGNFQGQMRQKSNILLKNKHSEAETFFTNDPLVIGKQIWGHFNAKIPEAWAISKGNANIVIGIIDSGFELDHPDLRDQMAYNNAERFGKANIDDDKNGFIDDSLGYDFGDNDNNTYLDSKNLVDLTPYHGTMVSGIACATPNNSRGLAGVGMNCKMMPIKVYSKNNKNGTVDALALYKAIEYAADQGCQIINISITQSSVFLQWQQDIINSVIKKNVLIVAAAGNSEQEINFYPASYQGVLSVIHSDQFDERNKQGSVSKYIDLMAPGVNSWTTNINSGYLEISGSSFASPFVAGAAGLIKEKFPNLTALQIAELLRQSSDPVYQIKSNQAFTEKLGKGRINVYRALTELDILKSVRMKNAFFSNRYGNFSFREDTVLLNISFINFLKASSSGLKVKISSESKYVNILKNEFILGNMATLDSAKGNFQLILTSDTPPSAEIEFRLQYEDQNYSDYEYFKVKTSPNFFHAKFNDLNLTVSANGRLAFAEIQQNGKGLEYQNQNILKESGLMVALSKGQVANTIWSKNNQRSDDFKTIKNVRMNDPSLQGVSLDCSFSDTSTTNKNAIGLLIDQSVKAKINEPHRKYIVLEYQIKNISLNDYDSLQVGLYADWQIGDGKNKVDWDKNGKFSYIFQENNLYAGIKVFGENNIAHALDQSSMPEFTVLQKYQTLTNGLGKLQAGYENPADVAHVVASKISSMRSGSVRKVSFVMAVAENLEELQNIFQTASIYQNPLSSKSTKPNIPSVLCFENPMILPEKGEKFRFYDAKDLTKSLATASFLKVSPADTTKSYYISNVDSQIESELQFFRFKTYLPKAKFESVDFVNAIDSSKIRFTDRSPTARKWAWDFGDGSFSSLQNPLHEFKQLGTYQVKLTIWDSVSCSNSFQKTVKVVRNSLSPPPVLPTKIRACVADTIQILPKNGTKFRFYNPLVFNTPMATGTKYALTDTSLNYLLVTCIDSVLESDRREIQIEWSKIQTKFDFSPKIDTVLFTPIQFSNQSISNLGIKKILWDFGDKTTSNLPKPIHKYSKMGIFTVKLTITDSLNCSRVLEKTIRVGRKSQKPVILDTAVCKNTNLLIRPKNGKIFNFYDALPLKTPIFSGNQYFISVDQPLRLYITCADSVVESDPVSILILVNESSANFNFEQNQNDNYQISFKNMSFSAIRWEWNFGDGKGKSTAQNPEYRYQKQGIYQIQLSIFDKNNCTATVTKNIEIKGKSPVPQNITPIIFCENDLLQLAPKGGSKFYLYAAPPPSQPVASGKSFSIGRLSESATYYLTCADSLLESEVLTVEFIKNDLWAQMKITSPDKQNIMYSQDTIWFEAISEKAISWIWDLGNGQKSNNKKVFATYSAGGIYKISLAVQDVTNCNFKTEKDLTVLTSLIAINLPDQIKVFPNPATNELSLSMDFGKTVQLNMLLYNALGQQMDWKIQDKIVRANYALNLQNYPRGMYFLQCFVDGEMVVKKILLE